jgi:hypothetical protein
MLQTSSTYIDYVVLAAAKQQQKKIQLCAKDYDEADEAIKHMYRHRPCPREVSIADLFIIKRIRDFNAQCTG